jgi:hypothetical protein
MDQGNPIKSDLTSPPARKGVVKGFSAALKAAGILFRRGPRATGGLCFMLKIQAAFEQAGIQFIDDDEIGGFGLRMAKKRRESGKRFRKRAVRYDCFSCQSVACGARCDMD